jgi:hypothetical protein
MPYQFSYYYNDHLLFQENLKCTQCQAITKAGTRCSLVSCIGQGYCWIHLKYNKHLRIKTSTIPNAGKGLFAINTKLPHHPQQPHHPDHVVFKPGDTITDYGGEVITHAQLQARYGNHAAPYAAVQTTSNGGRYEDGATLRGVGTMANKPPTGKPYNAVLSYSPTRQKLTLKASRRIYNHQEIFLSYGNQYNRNSSGTRHATRKVRHNY